ncbi:hypothetical protein WA1_22560 [Scytonema hofmannii PCC 7110]|uniref:Inactive STAND domain-containing protein n=1 Tax=Scytonema hofmannii PCC 7110 TaxID=128403 RepID=A0A139X977_9CYAN|nr:hypothetical protein [Scytonema hofmannii]KYC41250.1 hypothetical protein WA1_22560 [Scytonema hofmannii PCC 7110]
MSQREQLQKLLDLIDEKILFFQEQTILATDPKAIFALNKQIEKDKAERSKIEQQMSDVEAKACSEALYDALIKLGYREQVRSFKKFQQTPSIKAFLIHGYPEYGQSWLLNRLMTQHILFGTSGKAIRIELDRLGRKRDIGALWRELGRRVGLEQHSPTEIAERVFQCWKTQNVILILHYVDCMPEAYLQELLQEFWLPLASKPRKEVSQDHQFQLLMFLVDYEGRVGCGNTMFVERLEPTWEPRIPIKLPALAPFGDRTLTDWIETVETDKEFDTLPLIKEINKWDDPAQVILDKTENGIPELVFSEICKMCGCNWYEEKDRWLKH